MNMKPNRIALFLAKILGRPEGENIKPSNATEYYLNEIAENGSGDLPDPTPQDSGKVVVVGTNGNYELGEVSSGAEPMFVTMQRGVLSQTFIGIWNAFRAGRLVVIRLSTDVYTVVSINRDSEDGGGTLRYVDGASGAIGRFFAANDNAMPTLQT